ncbi:hypothetical protein LXL04_011865 [Taraxacum kok-saghyz]
MPSCSPSYRAGLSLTAFNAFGAVRTEANGGNELLFRDQKKATWPDITGFVLCGTNVALTWPGKSQHGLTIVDAVSLWA